MKKIVATTAITMVGAAVLYGVWKFAFAHIALGPGLCADSILEKAESAGGSIKAVSFTRDCGATTRIATRIRLEEVGLFGETSDVFVYEGSIRTEFEWQSSKSLTIVLTPTVAKLNPSVFMMEDEALGVKIDWQ